MISTCGAARRQSHRHTSRGPCGTRRLRMHMGVLCRTPRAFLFAEDAQ